MRPWAKRSLTRGYNQWTIIKPSAQKVVAVAHKMWSLTSGSFYRALTRKPLEFWIGSRLPEVVADECWTHVEVRLSILGCLACMSYIEKVGDDVIGKEQQGRLKTIQWFKGIKFFFVGVLCFTFVRTFRYPRNSYVGKAIHHFFSLFIVL